MTNNEEKLMKENLKFWLLASALAFFVCFPASSSAATLSAPERVDAGRLATVKSDVKGDWLVYPPDAADLAKDSDEQTLYFVARKDGELTIIFFGVENSKPVISQTTLIIGATPEPEPAPEPSPSPDPAPSPVVKKLTAADRQALAASLEFTISSMESGKIRTIQGARSTFKQSISAKASVCNGVSCRLKPEISEVLDAWTEEADFSTLETTRKSFEHFLEAVK